MGINSFLATLFGLSSFLCTVSGESGKVRGVAEFEQSEYKPGPHFRGPNISNLNESCFRCLCHVAGCDVARGCSDGYCGPFFISRVYWVDADKPTLPDDVPDRKEAFEDCARDYHCSLKIIESYMAKFGKDCNNDGVTDCFDYMMINYHGGRACSKPLFLTQSGRRWLNSYQQCRF